MYRKLLIGILLTILSLMVSAQQSMDEKLKGIDASNKEISKYDEETQWVIKGELLSRRIDRLIDDWHRQRDRDLYKEAIHKALSDIDNHIMREKQLTKNTGKSSEYLMRLKDHKNKLMNML